MFYLASFIVQVSNATAQDETLSTLCMLGNFFMLLLSSADCFKINFFAKKSFRNTIRVSHGLVQIRTDVLHFCHLLIFFSKLN